MEEGRRSKKGKAEDAQWQQDHHWEGKKKTKKKKKKELKQNNASVTPSSSRDHSVLEQKIKEKKPKILLCGGEVPWPVEKEIELKKAVAEEGEGIYVCTEQVFDVKKKAKNVAHSLCKLKEAQEDHSHDVHVDRNVYFDASKRQCKKVRFSDQFAPCKCRRNVSEEFCMRNSSVSKESSANSCAGQSNFTVSCSCREENSKEVPFQDVATMNSNAGQVGMAVDEKNLFNCRKQSDEDDEIWGKRFTPEENKLLRNTVLNYIKVKGWEEKEGISKVLNCRKHKEARNCWGVIRLCLPHRPHNAVRRRALLLFEEGGHLGRWSKEEEELLKRLHKNHGSRWTYLSTLVGRSRCSARGKWRCLKRPKATAA